MYHCPAQTNHSAVTVQWRNDRYGALHCLIHILEVRHIGELQHKLRMEGFLGLACIKILIKECKALKKHIGYVPGLNVTVCTVQKCHDDCECCEANVVVPVTQIVLC